MTLPLILAISSMMGIGDIPIRKGKKTDRLTPLTNQQKKNRNKAKSARKARKKNR